MSTGRSAQEYTDRSGQERYSTEVVIGHFKGELVLLDLDSSQSHEG
jgi:hypothetical protein